MLLLQLVRDHQPVWSGLCPSQRYLAFHPDCSASTRETDRPRPRYNELTCLLDPREALHAWQTRGAMAPAAHKYRGNEADGMGPAGCDMPGWAGAAGAVGLTGARGKTGSTWLPCALKFKVWKRSGAWFYKGIPKYILPLKTPGQADHPHFRPLPMEPAEQEPRSTESGRVYTWARDRDWVGSPPGPQSTRPLESGFPSPSAAPSSMVRGARQQAGVRAAVCGPDQSLSAKPGPRSTPFSPN
ncbi:hypothetical protein J1605_008886 [Eschrichtius robustus]|uniref:Uncharacterized protein n=1 Tax=Eschrichtius robustus TaxID=9764 RepID=A0AB34GUR0_ESCRO|nr:hypothetical protein J1605_008886 [Eschrichtius robustus]